MFRSTGGFDKLLDKATSHLLMEPDWPSIIQICDLIRQNDIQPKVALAAVKKKLVAPNPHSALYALLCLESMVKNCGALIAQELTLKPNCDFLHELVKTTQHENVKQKLLELIQTWNFAFRKNPKHSNLQDLMAEMKAEGHKFPVLRESDAMFAADTAPDWRDGDSCHRCRVQFTLLQRKHHCRACGQVFCGQCTTKTTTLPKFGIEKEVRVCDTCFDKANKPAPAPKSPKQETELPPEYLSSSLAQQSQEPPRKSEEDLKEEEELQLALALSQSEAEAKEKEKLRVTNALLNHNSIKKEPEPILTRRTPTPPPEEPASTNNPELDRYLNRSYWESLQNDTKDRPTSPSAPSPASSIISNNEPLKYIKTNKENEMGDSALEEFTATLKSQVEVFINRMKSNSSRGRSIANDNSVQTLFMSITNMHSKLLRYIQDHDDRRLHYEGLQDKLTQVKDARAALDALREEHREKLRREAEEIERQRQLQMAHKLDIMRKKKQEYLQYQRQLALQRIQEQEREMQMRQEQQKQQYLMGGAQQFAGYVPQYQPPNSAPPSGYYGPYQMMGPPPNSAPSMPQMGPHPQAFPPQPQGQFNPPPGMMVVQNPAMPQGQMGFPPQPGPLVVQNQPPQQQQPQQSDEQAQTGELISFD